MADDLDLVAEQLVETSLRMYPAVDHAVGMRSALGDAAVLLDAVHEKVKVDHPGKQDGVSVEGSKLLKVIKQCADAIWNMRSKIDPKGDPLSRTVSIQGAMHIRHTLSAVNARISCIKENLRDVGDGYMETPDGFNQNDLLILQEVAASLERALM